MLLKAFTIYDTKVQVYHAPFFMPNAAAAIRAFNDLAADPGTTIGRHPSDYVLFEIGSFNDQNASLMSAELVSHGPPRLVSAPQPSLPLATE